MTASRWEQIEERFLAAADLEPAARDAYLRDACGDDGDLRGEVDALLRAELSPDDAIPGAVSSAAQDFAEHLVSSRVGERVGAYRLVDVIGHGGMGTVYLAERADDAYRARVAIKFVRGVHAAPDLARRFVAERQILADLNHPGIARLLDGGTTVDGTPYLVLEYIDGTPIDAWCDAHQPGVRERIELFLKVCDAVQYAHDVRVVHRDLKPSNILVTADGTPKLVDFGIAKLLSDGSPDDTTVAALRVLTPAYASPEQVRGEAVTFASDVYSLGMVLYQLLAQRPPYDLSHASAGEVERRICHDVPIPLSWAAVGRDGAWRDALAGELDAITATALRKRVDQRHPSVAALATELRQYLAAPPDRPLRRPWRRLRRVRPATVVGLAGVLVVTPFAVRSLAKRGDAAIAFAMLPVQVTTAPVRSPYRVVTADLNGDGRGDVVWNHVGPTINQVAVALGSPDGTIVMQPVVTDSIPFAEWSQDFHLVVGDFDGDGRDDLLWHRTGNGLRNIAWIGFSGADAALRFRGPVTLGGEVQRWANGWEAFVGDLDNDGCDDLVFNHRTQNNSTWALRSLRYGTFALIGPMAHSAKGWGGYRAFLADVDGDKRADIVWNDVPVWSNRTYVARSRGDGFGLLPQQDHIVKEGWSRFHTSVADFDGDGISDLLWTAREADSVLVYIGRGQSTGVFELLLAQHLRLRNSSGMQTTLPVIGDFNGDRRSDVLWQSGSNAWIMAGGSSNRFTLRPAAVNMVDGELATDLGTLDVLPSDVNGDEREDLVWIDRVNGRAYVALAVLPR